MLGFWVVLAHFESVLHTFGTDIPVLVRHVIIYYCDCMRHEYYCNSLAYLKPFTWQQLASGLQGRDEETDGDDTESASTIEVTMTSCRHHFFD